MKPGGAAAEASWELPSSRSSRSPGIRQDEVLLGHTHTPTLPSQHNHSLWNDKEGMETLTSPLETGHNWAEEQAWGLHLGLGYMEGSRGAWGAGTGRCHFPARTLPGLPHRATAHTRALGTGRVKAAQAVPRHQTQAWHCTPRTAVYMISHSLSVCLVCALKIEFMGRRMWAKMTNNWQVFARSGEAPEFLGAKALHASPKNPNHTPVPRLHPRTGTEHTIPPAGSIRRGVRMPCTDPRSQIPIPWLISSSPLWHSFTEISRNACRQRSWEPRVKIIIWLSEASLAAGLETPGTAIYWQNLKAYITDLA